MIIDDGRQNPYVGLRPFDREDAHYFFGRREQVAELLDRLHGSGFLAVVGSSGCGKSSLIRAGLVPALLGGFLVKERDHWHIGMMKPGDAPFRNLAATLCASGTDGHPDPDEIAALKDAIIRDHTQAVVSYLEKRLGTNTNQLLLVDQFEEIFAYRGMDNEERLAEKSLEQRQHRAACLAEAADFVNLIVELGARTDVPAYVVLTMRTDFLGDCDVFYGLPEAMNRGRYLVPRLTRRQLHEATTGPALLREAKLAPRLVDRLLNELGDRMDRLPVFQHALLRTWEYWQKGGEEGSIDIEHFEAVGSLNNALSMHAEEALEGADIEKTGRIFKCLTDTDEGHRRIRRPSRMSEICAVSSLEKPAAKEILNRFCEGGRHFLFFSESAVADDPRVDISHESLIRQWDRLRNWVDEERESSERFHELVRGARRELEGRAALLRNPELHVFHDWFGSAHPTPEWAERYSRKPDDFDVALRYLDRSWTDAVRRRRMKWGIVAGLLLIFALLSVWAGLSSIEAGKAARRSRDQAKVAVASEWVDRDPSLAANILLGLEELNFTRPVLSTMHRVLGHALARVSLEGHTDSLCTAEFSPDGKRVATGAWDGTARIWNVKSGELLATLPGHGGGGPARDVPS